jgi:hypothetical protein
LSLEIEINRLKSLLNSLESSYKLINEYDVDGYKIDPQEYEILNISTDIYDTSKYHSEFVNNQITQDNYDDIDGEPI